MLTALPWLGSLQTSRDAGERPLHPQQEGTCAPHVSGSWDQSLHSSLCPGHSFSSYWQQGLYFFLVIERGHPILLLQVLADLGKEQELKYSAGLQVQVQAYQGNRSETESPQDSSLL